MRSKKLLALSLTFTLLFGFTGCSMIEKSQSAINKTVVAKIYNENITRGEVEDTVKKYYGDALKSLDKDTQVSVMKKVLTSLIQQKVLVKQADAMNITFDLSNVDQKVDDYIVKLKAEQFNGSEDEFNEYLKGQEVSLDDYKKFLKDDMTSNPDSYRANLVIEEFTKNVTVSDDEVKTYYDKNKASEFTTKAGAEVSAILVSDENTAKEVKGKLTNGEKFEELVKTYSQDSSTKDKEGKLGFYQFDDTTDSKKDIAAAAKGLEEGKYSDPIKTDKGYYIITVKNVVKEDVVKPLDEVKEELKKELLSEKKSEEIQKKYTEWENAAGLKTYESKLEKDIKTTTK